MQPEAIIMEKFLFGLPLQLCFQKIFKNHIHKLSKM